jgi:protoheme IX farnesyltransferase
MLPVSHGVPLTCLHILLYTVLLAAVSYLPATLGLSGGIYVGLVSLLNLGYLREAWRCGAIIPTPAPATPSATR